MVAHDQTIKEKPELVRAVTTAFSTASKLGKAQPELAKPFIRKYYKVSEADVESIYTKRIGFCAPRPFLNWKGFRTLGRAFPSFAGAAAASLRNISIPGSSMKHLSESK